MTWPFEAAGFLGVALYIGSYAALQTGLIGGRGYAYVTANLAAASLVLISLLTNFNLWSAVIQITWIGISLFGLVRLYLISRRLSFDADEQAMLQTGMRDMPAHLARALIDAGRWRDAQAGEVLAREGEEIGQLFFLGSGAAAVTLGGRRISRITAPAFIGEVTALHGGTATATVTLEEPARIFAIGSARLRAMAARDAEFRVHVEYALSLGTRDKLAAANQALSGGG